MLMSGRDLQALDAYFVAERMRHLEEYREFLRIPRVSALPSHREDMLRAADRVAGALRQADVPTVEIMPTAGHPVMYGTWPAEQPGTPRLLVYAHYDTQPANPFDEWTTPPFEPTIRHEVREPGMLPVSPNWD
jgi:acetylornithine deacetylase/succinyl-diaminopimelate desuccinylase-like protein